MNLNEMEIAIYLKANDNIKSNQNRLSPMVERVKSEGGQYKIFSETDDKNGNQPLKKILLSRVYNREFDAILVYRLNEWSDTPAKLSLELNELFVNGIRFISNYENFDSFSLTGKLYLRILLAINDCELSIDKSAKEIEKSSKQSVDQHPYGYTKTMRRTIVENPAGLNYFQGKVPSDDIGSSGNDSIPGMTAGIGKNSAKTDTFDLIGFDEACLLTGCSKNTLYQFTSRKLIPHFKRPHGRRIFFSKRSLEQWILTGKI